MIIGQLPSIWGSQTNKNTSGKLVNCTPKTAFNHVIFKCLEQGIKLFITLSKYFK